MSVIKCLNNLLEFSLNFHEITLNWQPTINPHRNCIFKTSTHMLLHRLKKTTNKTPKYIYVSFGSYENDSIRCQATPSQWCLVGKNIYIDSVTLTLSGFVITLNYFSRTYKFKYFNNIKEYILLLIYIFWFKSE